MNAEHPTEQFDLGTVEVTVVLDAGPRILGYARHDGPQLFASLPGAVIERDDAPPFEFVGGHRLWRAPEVPAVTYRPDARPIVEPTEGGVRVSGPADEDGLAKTMTLRQHGAVTVVDHTLRNEGSSTIRCAPWAITQLSPGGTAMLPLATDVADPDGVLPNRSIVLWPYTDPSAPEIELGTAEIRVEATDSTQAAKLGTANRRGWLAYEQGGELFVKWSPLHRDDAEYVDLGASVQCYRDHRFLELESLGPSSDLSPGAELQHREVWTLLPLDGRPVEEVLASLPEQPPEIRA